MPSEYDLSTLSRAAHRLRVAAEEPELPHLLTAASQALAGWLGYPLHLREDVVETAPSEGGRYLFLRAGQVRRVVRVEVGGAEVPPGDYVLDSARTGRLVRRRGTWPFTGTYTAGVSPLPHTTYDTGEILVTLDAGWRTPGQVALALAEDSGSPLASEVPAALEEACLLTLTALHASAGRDPNVTSRSIGGGSLSWAAVRTTVPDQAQQLARPYYKTHRRGA